MKDKETPKPAEQKCCPNCKSNLWLSAVRYKMIGGNMVVAENLWQCAICHGQFTVEQMEQVKPIA